MPFSLCTISLALFVLSSYLGHTLFFKLVGYPTTKDKLATLFLSSLLGFLFLVSGYAVIVKGISTVMIFPFGVLLAGIFYSFSPKVLFFSKEFILLIVLHFCWALYFNYTINISQDALFYSLITKSISLSPENYFLTNNLVSPSYQGTTPYHYGEMWATHLLLFFFKYHAVEIMTRIIYPFVSFLCILGMIASTHCALSLMSRAVYGTVLIFASATFYSLKTHSFIQGLNLYIFNITSEVFFKLLFILPLSFASAWWLKRRAEIGFVILFQLPFFSFVLSPAVYGGSFLTLLFLMQTKNLSPKRGITLILLLAAHVTGLFGFYVLAPSPDLTGWTFTQLYSYYWSNLSYSLITFRNILIGQPLFVLLSLLPCAGLFFLFHPTKNILKEYHVHLVLACGITFSGILAFACLFPVRDSIQLAQVAWIAVGFIFLLTVLASKPMLKSIYLSFIVLLTIVNIGFSIYSVSAYQTHYSSEFITRINASLKDKSLLKIGSIRKGSSLEDYFLYLQPILPFKDLPAFWGCIPMTRPRPILTDSLTKFRALDIEQESAFYEYMVKKKGRIWTLKSIDWEESFCAYTDSVHLDAILVEQGAPIPLCLRMNTAHTSIVDTLSGEELFILN